MNNKALVSGLSLVNSLVEVVTFDIRTQNYTMSGVNENEANSGDNASMCCRPTVRR